MRRSERRLLAALLAAAVLVRMPWLAGLHAVGVNWDERFILDNARKLGIDHAT